MVLPDVVTVSKVTLADIKPPSTVNCPDIITSGAVKYRVSLAVTSNNASSLLTA